MMAERSAAGPRIGIVGFGRMVEVCHLQALRAAGFDVAAALDITLSRRDAARAAGVPRICENLEDFIATGLDAALITTHTSVRAEVALPLAQAGLHLMIDKPLASTAPEARAICEAAERAGVLATVFHNRRWDPDIVMVRQALREGLLGELVHVENRSFHGETAVGFGTPDFCQPWRITRAMGGGTLLDFGPHWLDQIFSITEAQGPVVSVFADVRHVVHGDADDHFTILLVFESGLRAIAGKSDFCPIGPDFKWFLLGTEGAAVYRSDRLEIARRDGARVTLDSAPPGPDLHRNFRDAIEGRADLLVTARQSLRTCDAMDAARESARTCGSVGVRI